MKLEQLFIGLLKFSLFMVGGALIFNDLHTTYELTSDVSVFNGTTGESSDSVFDVIKDINKTTSELQGKIITDDEGFSAIAAVDALFGGAYTAVKLIGSSFSLVNAIIGQVSSTIGLPPFIGATIFIIMVLAVVFTIIYLMFRFKP